MSVQTISSASDAAPGMSARSRDLLLNITSPLALLIVWELCARFGFIDTRFFPAPSKIMATMFEMLGTGELVAHTAISLQRLAYGTVLGSVPALTGTGAWRAPSSLRMLAGAGGVAAKRGGASFATSSFVRPVRTLAGCASGSHPATA